MRCFQVIEGVYHVEISGRSRHPLGTCAEPVRKTSIGPGIGPTYDPTSGTRLIARLLVPTISSTISRANSVLVGARVGGRQWSSGDVG